MLFNISYTTLNFIFFVLVAMLVYFLFPVKKYQWTVLLAASVFFYAVACYKFAAFILFTTASTYLIALLLTRVSVKSKALLKEKKRSGTRSRKSALSSN